MTALNLALSDRQAFIVQDTGLFSASGGLSGLASKTLCLPHMRMVVAAAGSCGPLVEWKRMLLLGYPAADVEELNQTTPAILRSYGQQMRVVHVGAVGNRVVAFDYRHENNFEPLRLAPGCYIAPAFRAPAAVEHPSDDALSCNEPMPAAPRRPVWGDTTRTVTRAIQRQHIEHPDCIAGRPVCTHLTPDSIHQTWLDPFAAKTAEAAA